MSQRKLGLLLAATTGLCWSVLAIGLKYALHFSSSGSIVWTRMVFAFVTLGIYISIRNPKSIIKIIRNVSIWSLVAGIFLSANYFGFMKSIELTTASHAQVMIQLGPVALLLAGVFIFKEELRFAQWLGVLIAGFGFLLFNWNQASLSLADKDVFALGTAWVIFAAIAWAAYAVIQKKLILRGWTPQEINFVIFFASSIILLPAANYSDFVDHSPWQWTVYYLLALNTLIAYTAFAEALARIPASQVSLIISVNPLLTIILMQIIAYFGGTFVSPEPIHWQGAVGALLVVVGVATAVSLRRKTANMT